MTKLPTPNRGSSPGSQLAALIVWKLEAMKATSNITCPLVAKIHQLMLVLSA